MRVHSISWLAEPRAATCRLEGRVRHRDPRVPLLLEPEPGGVTARVVFDSPQRGLAGGQILALYEGERLLGGAVFA
jgi:tRNA-specific 2-thiouridylase